MSKVVKTIKLIKTDAKNNNNKFWQGELMDNDDVVCSWGRVGATSPQSKEFPSAGESYLEKKKREKEKKGYREVQAVDKTAVSDGGKSLAKMAIKDVAKKQIKHSDPMISKLIDTLVSQNRHQIMSMSGGQIEVSTDGMIKTILGDVLDDSSITAARAQLDLLGKFFKANKSIRHGSDKFDDDAWIDPLNEYLKIVPQKVSHARGWHRSLFTSAADIQAQSAFVDQLESSIKLALDAQKDAKKKAGKDPKAPQVFNTELTVIDDKAVIDRIRKFYKLHAKSMHASYGFKVKNVFGVHIDSMEKAYAKKGAKMSNIWELWHGTSVSNVLSMLKSGYIIPPSNASHVTGRMFGNGVYFSDQSTKSLNYAYGYWSGSYSSSNCYMFLNDVAMGNYHTPRSSTSKNPPKGYDSYFAQGGKSSVMNNEMIVFDTAQINIKYLVEFSK